MYTAVRPSSSSYSYVFSIVCMEKKIILVSSLGNIMKISLGMPTVQTCTCQDLSIDSPIVLFYYLLQYKIFWSRNVLRRVSIVSSRIRLGIYGHGQVWTCLDKSG